MKTKTAEEIIAASIEARKQRNLQPLRYAVNPAKNAVAVKAADCLPWSIAAALLITGEWINCSERLLANDVKVFKDWEEVTE